MLLIPSVPDQACYLVMEGTPITGSGWVMGLCRWAAACVLAHLTLMLPGVCCRCWQSLLALMHVDGNSSSLLTVCGWGLAANSKLAVR